MSKESYFPSNRDLAFFRSAEAISNISDHKYQIGCVVVNGHKIISSGCNSHIRKHPFQARLDKKKFNADCAGYLHAEIDALLPLIRDKIDLSRATIYTFRKHRNGNIAMSRPCSRCMSVIKSLGIRKIKYSTEYGYASEVIL